MANARRGFKVQLSSLTAAKCSLRENLFRVFAAYFSLNSRFAFSYAYFSIHCNLSLIQANICPQNFLILLHFFLFFVCFYFRIFGCCGLFALLLFIYLFLFFFWGYCCCKFNFRLSGHAFSAEFSLFVLYFSFNLHNLHCFFRELEKP